MMYTINQTNENWIWPTSDSFYIITYVCSPLNSTYGEEIASGRWFYFKRNHFPLYCFSLQGYKPPDEGPSEYQTIPLNKIEDFGVHCKQYYSLEVNYFKSALDRKLLESLWNKYWVNTLSSSSLLAVSWDRYLVISGWPKSVISCRLKITNRWRK